MARSYSTRGSRGALSPQSSLPIPAGAIPGISALTASERAKPSIPGYNVASVMFILWSSARTSMRAAAAISSFFNHSVPADASLSVAAKIHLNGLRRVLAQRKAPCWIVMRSLVRNGSTGATIAGRSPSFLRRPKKVTLKFSQELMKSSHDARSLCSSNLGLRFANVLRTSRLRIMLRACFLSLNWLIAQIAHGLSSLASRAAKKAAMYGDLVQSRSREGAP